MTINIYIDSNVLVSSEIKSEPQYNASRKLVDYILESHFRDVKFFTSKFTLLEIASAIIRRTKDKDKAYACLYRIKNSWGEKIESMEPEKRRSWAKLLDELIETTIKLRTKSGDTIHAQIIKDYRVDFLITWNKKDFSSLVRLLKRVKVTLKVMTPTEFLRELEKIKKKEHRYDKLNLILNNYLKSFSRLTSMGNKMFHSSNKT